MYNVKRFKFARNKTNKIIHLIPIGLHPPLSIYSVQIVHPHKNSWEVLVREATLKADFLTAVALVRVLVVTYNCCSVRPELSVSVIGCSTVVMLL